MSHLSSILIDPRLRERSPATVNMSSGHQQHSSTAARNNSGQAQDPNAHPGAAGNGPQRGSVSSATPSAPPRQSCTACRARKIKCNKALPHCAQCQRAGTNCFYAASQRRGRPRNGAVTVQPLSKEAQLEKRVKQLEAVIASLRGSTGGIDVSTKVNHVIR